MVFALSINFTTPLGLIGLIAVVIPLLLALLLRPRPIPIRWAAMRILEKAAKKMRTRIRLHDTTRLVLRMSLLGICALAIAGPFVNFRSNVDFSQPNSNPEHELKILLIDGAESGRKRIFDEISYSRDDIPAAYISAALNAPGMKIDRIKAGEFAGSAELSLENYDLVILADIARPNEDELAAIEKFLQGGGGLLVFFGTRIDATAWNDGFMAEFFENVQLGPVEKNDQIGQLNPHAYKSDLVRAFKGHPNSGLWDLPIRYYHPIKCDEKAAVISLANNEPLILDASGQLKSGYGKDSSSRVILVAFAPEMSMGAVPLWPSFVPLMQELVQGLSPERRAIQAAPEIPFPLTPWLIIIATAVLAAEIFLGRKDNLILVERPA